MSTGKTPMALRALASVVGMEAREATADDIKAMFQAAASRLWQLEGQAYKNDFGRLRDGTPLTLMDAYGTALRPVKEAGEMAEARGDTAAITAAKRLIDDFEKSRADVLAQLSGEAHDPDAPVSVPLSPSMQLTHAVSAPKTAQFKRK